MQKIHNDLRETYLQKYYFSKWTLLLFDAPVCNFFELKLNINFFFFYIISRSRFVRDVPARQRCPYQNPIRTHMLNLQVYCNFAHKGDTGRANNHCSLLQKVWNISFHIDSNAYRIGDVCVIKMRA